MQTNSLFITNGKLNEPGHKFHGQKVFILIENGLIKRLEKITFECKAETLIDAKDCDISVGMFDLRCQLKDPGFEHQEDLESGCIAAAAGGFTGLAVQPTTSPIAQTKSQIEYIKSKGNKFLPLVIPVGAATQDFGSTEITEMYDMRQAGALAFSNGDSAYHSGGGLMRVLMYASSVGGLVMSHAQDKHLTGEGMVNESETTIHTGLKQQSTLAETTQIQKEIEISEYTKYPIHFSHISCAKSVDIIRNAKASGKSVSCDVSIWHLIYTDANVLDFDTNYKVLPPYRTELDRLALIEGVIDGTIDVVVSDHNPHNIENKLVEFDYASYGITGLQTFYSIYNQHLKTLISEDIWWNRTVSKPRELLKIDVPTIAVDQEADLWISNPKTTWVLDKKTNKSKSTNNPLWNQQLTGKCIAAVRGKQIEVFNI